MEMSILIPEKVLQTIKKEKPELYEDALRFNRRITEFYNTYGVEAVEEAWKKSSPSTLEEAVRLSVDERLDLLKKALY